MLDEWMDGKIIFLIPNNSIQNIVLLHLNI